MISESAFIGCENCPEVMKGQFDKPWHYLGDVKPGQHFLNVVCKCQQAPLNFLAEVHEVPEPMEIMSLRPFTFVTDDMLIVIVYFGVCGECGRVVWAKEGPPFKRARSFVPAET